MEAAVSNKGKKFTTFLVRYNAVLIFVALFIISAVLSPLFLTPGNIINILRQNTPLMIIALGMLYVILTGGIDLSVGSVAAACCMILSVFITNFNLNTAGGLVISLIVCILVGIGFGAANGALIAYLKMAPFVVTLAMTTIAQGIAYIITNGQPVRWTSGTTATNALVGFGMNSAGLPYIVWLGIIILAIFIFVTRYTVFGRMLIATGSNAEAVRLSGIKSSFYTFMAYLISGAMAAIGGVIMASRTGQGAPTIGTDYELDAIASCVIGGASLSGGKGNVGNTIIGVLVLALITNIMNLLSVPAYPQKIVKGLIIIAAVLLNTIGENAKKAR